MKYQYITYVYDYIKIIESNIYGYYCNYMCYIYIFK